MWRNKHAQRHKEFILVWPHKTYVQSPYTILQEPSLVPKIGTLDYFWSGDSLSNPIFHSPEDSHPMVLIRCWGTNPVLAAQGTDASFWSGVALTKLVSEQRLCLCSNKGTTEKKERLQKETSEPERVKIQRTGTRREQKKYSIIKMRLFSQVRFWGRCREGESFWRAEALKCDHDEQLWKEGAWGSLALELERLSESSQLAIVSA